MAQSYLPVSTRVAGHACAVADCDKQRRYPAQRGRHVTTFALESWGRLGDEGEATLAILAAAASRFDARRGRHAHGRLSRWRCAIDGALQHGVARALHSSRFGLGGRLARHAAHA